jgi:hypothetical protein
MVVTVFLLTVATRTPSVGENQASAWHFGDIVDMAARVAIVTLDDKNIGLVKGRKNIFISLSRFADTVPLPFREGVAAFWP